MALQLVDISRRQAYTAMKNGHNQWRVGRKVGRTIYIKISDKPGEPDRLIGVMDSPQLARRAVDAVNEIDNVREALKDAYRVLRMLRDDDAPIDELIEDAREVLDD